MFSGLVTDPAGRPIEGVNIQWGGHIGFRDYSTHRAITNADGIYILETQNNEPLPILYAYGRGWAPTQFKVFQLGPNAPPQEINFTLQPGHWVEGILINRKGQPAAERYVRVTTPSIDLPGWKYLYHVQTDNLGYFRFEDLPGPEVMLTLEDSTDNSTIQPLWAKVDRQVEIVME
jgi:hypothetical protein